MLNEKDIKQQYTTLFLEYNQRCYQLYLSGDEDPDYFLLGEFDLDVFAHPEILDQLPGSISSAYRYYFENVEGWARVCRVPLSNEFSYSICVTTDGDDGWLEIYNSDGTLIACGRFYLELIGWTAVDEVRKYVKTLDYPPDLNDRRNKTLWN